MTEFESTAIKICRVLSIFFMTYVHVNPGKDYWPAGVSVSLAYIGYILADVLGRASVPALSVLSGYLAVSAYRRRSNWWIYTQERWRTMMIPLIIWNVVIIFFSFVVFGITGARTSVVHHLHPFNEITPLLVVDRLTGFRYGSATSALNFLRDLFVCSLMLPLLSVFTRRVGVAGVGFIWVIGLTVGFSPIVIRPHIIMFFVAGVYLAQQSARLIPSIVTAVKLLSTLILAILLVYIVNSIEASYGNDLPNTVLRLVMGCVFLTTTVVLSRTKAGRLIAELEPLIYLLFLSHTFIILVLWGVWQQFFGTDLDWPYAFFYVVAPVAALLLVSGLQRALVSTPASVQLLLGGRVVSPRGSLI